MKQAEQVAMNYAAQAERDVRAISNGTHGKLKPYLRLLADGIKSSVHFQVPVNGEFFDAEVRVDRWGDTTARLPYESITIEYESDSESKHGYDGFVIHAREARDEEDGNRTIVATAVGRAADTGRWMIFPVVALIRGGDYLNECRVGLHFMNPHGADIKMDSELREAGADIASVAAGVVMELLAALSCSNVSEAKLPRPNPLSIAGRRATKGGLPLYETKVLTIAPVDASEPQALGGTHNSPRAHLRRGHIRRLASGKSVWVNATVVGKKELGLIYKSYNVAGLPGGSK
jgi:hypothetical protein